MLHWLVGWVKPEIITTVVPTAQASYDNPLERQMKNSAWSSSHRARSTSDLSPVSPSASSGIWVHHEPLAVGPLEVDAEHAIARLLEKAYDLPPARGIVPAFGLQRVLHRDADVGLGYGRLRSGMAMRSGISVGSM